MFRHARLLRHVASCIATTAALDQTGRAALRRQQGRRWPGCAVLDDTYDRETEDVTAGMVRRRRCLSPEMWRRTVAVNAKRPELVHMFSTLSAEALNPDHPAHDYFAEREERIVEVAATSAGICRKALTPSRCCVSGIRDDGWRAAALAAGSGARPERNVGALRGRPLPPATVGGLSLTMR